MTMQAQLFPSAATLDDVRDVLAGRLKYKVVVREALWWDRLEVNVEYPKLGYRHLQIHTRVSDDGEDEFIVSWWCNRRDTGACLSIPRSIDYLIDYLRRSEILP